MRKRPGLLLSLVLLLASSADAEERENLAARHLRPSFRTSLDEAAHLLESPGCRAVLGDFVDGSGRSLAANLESTGLTANEYFDRVYFTGGAGVRRCQSSRVLATTSPGSRVVFVCEAFYAQRSDAPHLAYTLIHEMLHSLGLGENPPSPAAITRRVAERCGAPAVTASLSEKSR